MALHEATQEDDDEGQVWAAEVDSGKVQGSHEGRDGGNRGVGENEVEVRVAGQKKHESLPNDGTNLA